MRRGRSLICAAPRSGREVPEQGAEGIGGIRKQQRGVTQANWGLMVITLLVLGAVAFGVTLLWRERK